MYDYDLTGIIASTVNGEVTKYVKDPHGNVVVTSRNGSIAGEYDYSAFGEQLTATDTTNPFRYCGEYYDNENGLTYLRNRYYDSNTGRFLSEDPIKDGMNWYSYCGDDPVNAWDPIGLSYEEVINALNGLYYDRSIMEEYPSYTVEFQEAYSSALSNKEIIRNSDIYIEDWSGLSDTLDTIINGDNNTQNAILNVRNAVVAANVEWGKQNFVEDVIFVGSLAAVGVIIIRGGVAYVSGQAVTGSSIAAPIGFSTFSKLKEFIGSPGDGNQWHHIVEQCQIAKSGFTSTMIHATNNIYAVSADVHRQISAYYSSIQEFSNGMRVRDWLAGQGFDEQYKFGIEVLKMFGVIE